MFVSKRSWCLKLIDFGHAKFIKENSINGSGETTPTLTTQQEKSKLAEIPPFRSKSVQLKAAAFNAIGGRFAEWTAPEILRKYGLGGLKPETELIKLNPQTDIWGLGLITFCL